MKVTLSVIKADIGSIGGHITPSKRLLETVRQHVREKGEGLLIDSYVSATGDDIAILSTHTRGPVDEAVHKLCWDTFMKGTELAKSQGLYGAGQDLLKEAFSGNVRGMGPEVVEMEFDERLNEPFLFFAADKTDPGAYNLPLYLAFADPMNTPGLLLSSKLSRGFRFVIMDVNYTEGDRIIELNAPEELYDIAALLRDPERYVVESIWSRATGDLAAAVSTSRLHNIAGKYTGKDDPVMLVRTQMHFPATGEMLAPFAVGHFVAGGMRGSHNMPLMPVKLNSPISYFDGPPIVTCAAFAMHDGVMTEAVDAFDHAFWDSVRERVAGKAMEMRRQGFFGSAMLPMGELEYTGVMEKLEELDGRFEVRED
ncbi:MAG: fructose 1,6-bisphosphatase [Gammaproteobacteria bacterium]|nr:fructose 1,6-bisphosphatase [Gammaproteobacteria bacterium]NIR84017.1 fructose 1,6-bisphosphatase [Gammaproteobacteria bacterium]NIR89161.1 fructose 1,6-bisphosphatase [Gammaproteobacteria bacterium]NIU04963.1 fructose 1,6-bisphosphatase [Gammaproteobacteria bacterium]NIV52129.1 fructose 1,6-bisphosphatase [Gammaproteobacteria bacterium]